MGGSPLDSGLPDISDTLGTKNRALLDFFFVGDKYGDPQLVVLRGYSWLCLQVPSGASCQTRYSSTLISVLSLWTSFEFFAWFFFIVFHL